MAPKEDYCPGKVTGLEQYMSTNCRKRCCLKKVGERAPQDVTSTVASCCTCGACCFFFRARQVESQDSTSRPVPVLREPYLPVGRGEQGLEICK